MLVTSAPLGEVCLLYRAGSDRFSQCCLLQVKRLGLGDADVKGSRPAFLLVPASWCFGLKVTARKISRRGRPFRGSYCCVKHESGGHRLGLALASRSVSFPFRIKRKHYLI